MTVKSKFNISYVQHIESLFGSPGVITLSYWLGALFVSEIKKELGFFPALNLTGQQGSGRSTLCEILHALIGKLDYEGLDSRVTTAGLYHQATKQTTTPLVLLFLNESIDRDDKTSDLVRNFFTGSQYTRAPILSSENSIDFCPGVKARTVLVNLEPSKKHASCLPAELLLHTTMSVPFFSLIDGDSGALFFKNVISKFGFYSEKMESCHRKASRNYALLAAMTDSLRLIFDVRAESIERAIQSVIQTERIENPQSTI